MSLYPLLQRYQAAITATARDPTQLVTSLLVRDALAHRMAQGELLDQIEQRRLIDADTQLRELLQSADAETLKPWRDSIQPPVTAWWWHTAGSANIDKVARHEQRVRIGSQFLTLLAFGLIVEFLRRLWVGVPDLASLLGVTFATAIVGSGVNSPLRDSIVTALGRLRWLPGGSTLAQLWLAGMSVLLALLLIIPGLSILAGITNEQGLAALRANDLESARRYLERAAALNPTMAVPLQNLGVRYAERGLLDDAAAIFLKAIEREPDFLIPYAELGHVYNLQGEHAAAETVLTRALSLPDPPGATDAATADVLLVARYFMLADLGWAYFAQNKIALAKEALLAAAQLEGQLANLPETGAARRSAIPAYYLAQIYEDEDDPVRAYEKWREAVRQLDPESWPDRERYRHAVQRLTELEARAP